LAGIVTLIAPVAIFFSFSGFSWLLCDVLLKINVYENKNDDVGLGAGSYV
jgi:hypothetical protein